MYDDGYILFESDRHVEIRYTKGFNVILLLPLVIFVITLVLAYAI
jgi:hypothetical protein